MKIILNDLYMSQGDVIKKKMKKGDRVEISFKNISALGGSIVQDLKDFASLPNVQLVDVTNFVGGQLADQLGIELSGSDLQQMSLF